MTSGKRARSRCKLTALDLSLTAVPTDGPSPAPPPCCSKMSSLWLALNSCSILAFLALSLTVLGLDTSCARSAAGAARGCVLLPLDPLPLPPPPRPGCSWCRAAASRGSTNTLHFFRRLEVEES